MKEIDVNTITIDRLSFPFLTEKNLHLDILRLDKIHAIVSGNKWFKLRYHIEAAKQAGATTVLTFGGAWSNHIIATAAACRMNALGSIGLIRGEEPELLSATLQKAKEMGMQLYFLNREEYKSKTIPVTINREECYIIPEGGYDSKGAEGASTITDHYNKERYTHICCAAGTGTMAAGLVKASPATATIIAISALKGYVELENDIRQLSGKSQAYLQVIHDYHFGGYAKHDPELVQFMNNFFLQTGIPTDFVYTAKTCYAVLDMAQKDFFAAGSHVLIIHSGGLQGNESFSKGTLIF